VSFLIPLILACTNVPADEVNEMSEPLKKVEMTFLFFFQDKVICRLGAGQ
jgi:hypothetical protein